MQSRLFTSVLSTSYSHYDDITLTIIKADTMFTVMEYLTQASFKSLHVDFQNILK